MGTLATVALGPMAKVRPVAAAEAIAGTLDAEHGSCGVRRFPDGYSYLRAETVVAGRIVGFDGIPHPSNAIGLGELIVAGAVKGWV